MKKQNFKLSLVRLGKSKRTVIEYQARFRDFYQFLISELDKFDPFEATTVDIISYREFLKEKGQTMYTINAKLNSVATYYQLACLDGKMRANPVIPGVYIKDEAPDAPVLSASDEKLLKLWMNHLPSEIGTAFWIMYGAGLRIGEVVKLKKDDIIVMDNHLYINVYVSDVNRNRTIPVLDEEAANAIWQYKLFYNGRNDERLFTVTKHLINKHAIRFNEETGITLFSHVLRYMIAEKLRNAGISKESINIYLGERIPNVEIFSWKSDQLKRKAHCTIEKVAAVIKNDNQSNKIDKKDDLTHE